jgi:hypothetical protein
MRPGFESPWGRHYKPVNHSVLVARARGPIPQHEIHVKTRDGAHGSAAAARIVSAWFDKSDARSADNTPDALTRTKEDTPVQAIRILPPIQAADDFSRRQFLPASAAVKGPRFRRRDWELSAQVREILDEINLPLTPRAERSIDPAESIVLAGNEIFNSLRTGGHVVKQRRTVDFAMLPELSIAEPVPVHVESLRNAAGEALAALNQRRVASVRRAVPEPSAGRSLVLFAAVLVLGALACAAWIAVRS